jgi:phosphoribosylformylglycinamidine synthase
MAVYSIDEALRNVICVGADPDRVAILDNLCWGDCGDSESLGGLVRACKGAYDAAAAYGLPFISGKDSLNNFFTQSPVEASRLGLPEKLSIPGTLLISALGVVPDVRRCVSMDLKPGGVLALVASPADRVGLAAASKFHRRVADAIRSGDVLAAHDLSDGGLAVAASEMCIASGMGLELTLDEAPGDEPGMKLFSEYPTAYLLQCRDEALVGGLNGIRIGRVTEQPRYVISHGQAPIIDVSVFELSRAWRGSPAEEGAAPCPSR